MGRVEHEIDKWIGAASMMWEVYIPFKAFVSNALMLHVINSEKPLNCCCHLLQHLKGSHNVHSTVRCFLLISPFFMGVFPPSTFQPRWDSYFFFPVFSWYQKAVIETTGEACGDNGASARQKHKKAQGETLSN